MLDSYFHISNGSKLLDFSSVLQDLGVRHQLPNNDEGLGVDEIIQAIINSGLETSGLSMLCKEHEIPHHFEVYR